jgi:putative transposase
VINLNPYKDASLSFGSLVQGLTMFVAEVHALQINQRKLSTPLELFQEGLDRCPPAIYPGDWEQFKLISGMSKSMTVGAGGLQFYGIPYGSAELLPWCKEVGPTFKTLCKWDPDDMGQMYVQHPKRYTEWVKCPSRWESYSAGLSFNQHRMIRNFAKEELRQKCTEEKLWAARMRLHDHWRDASRSKDRKSSLHAARAAGITSAGLYLQSASEPSQPKSTPAVEQIVLKPTSKQVLECTHIPDFDSFELRDVL